MNSHEVTTLAVETAFPMVSVALRIGDRVLEPRIDTSKARAAGLHPAVADLFEQASISSRDVNHILLDVGPGSYTGLRVGVAMVRTFAKLVDLDVRVVFSTDAVAMRARQHVANDETFVVSADARRGQWFVARYRFDSAGVLARLDEPSCVVRDAVEEYAMDARLVISSTDVAPCDIRQVQCGAPSATELFALEHLAFEEANPSPRYLMSAI